MAPPILSLRDVTLGFGGNPLFRGLEMHIGQTDRLCLLGRNGEGKSTLMKVIAGFIEADGGERFIQPGTHIAYLAQEPDVSGYDTLEDFIASGLPHGEEDALYKVHALAAEVGVDVTRDPKSASGGEIRRAAMAQALIGEPDLLLLDEPTNHLDIAAIEWLENMLSRWRGALILISHDRAFLRALARSVLWLDRGLVRRYDGPFDGFDAWQEEQFDLERDALKKLDKKIAVETKWSVEGISARRKRNMGRMRALQDLRAERRNAVRQVGSVDMNVKAGDASGKVVIEAKEVSKGFASEGGHRTLFDKLDLRILRGDRLGIIGPNGAGKSTLVKTLLGEIDPDEGSVKLGTNLTPLVIDQKRTPLLENKTVAETLTAGSGDWVVSRDGSRKHVMSYMQDFLFDKSVANTPVSALSGGERGRLLLARGFVDPTNLMVLDEPTNDLDMDTLDLLVDLLADYQGTLILVSHDRDFIDRIVTTSLVLDGEGGATVYAGGYTDVQAQKNAQKQAQQAEAGGDTTGGGATVTPITAARKAGADKRGPKKATKLSYKDQRELDALPAEVEGLGFLIAELEAQLYDPELYSKSPIKFQKISDKLTIAREDLDEKELRWLELEEMRESLGGTD